MLGWDALLSNAEVTYDICQPLTPGDVARLQCAESRLRRAAPRSWVATVASPIGLDDYERTGLGPDPRYLGNEGARRITRSWLALLRWMNMLAPVKSLTFEGTMQDSLAYRTILQAVAALTSTLRSLSVTGSARLELITFDASFTRNDISSLANGCPELQELTLPVDNETGPDGALFCVFRNIAHFQQLRLLDLYISSADVADLLHLRDLSRLEVLRLEGRLWGDADPLTLCSPSLTIIKFDGVFGVPQDEGFESLAMTSTALQQLKMTDRIGHRWSPLADVTQRAIDALGQLSSLEVLHFTDWRSSEDADMQQLSPRPLERTSLRELILPVPCFSMATMAGLRFAKLRMLELHGEGDADEKGMVAILKACPGLSIVWQTVVKGQDSDSDVSL